MTTDDAQRPDVNITIVHGTWGRLRGPFSGPLWFDEGSEFFESLRNELSARGLNASINAFLWSGSNSLFARADASSKLARKIDRQSTRFPNTRQVIIGHSHGGSVCMLSLQSLPPTVQPIVVTLATPFMEIINSAPTGSIGAFNRIFGRDSAFTLPVLLVLLWSMVWGLLNDAVVRSAPDSEKWALYFQTSGQILDYQLLVALVYFVTSLLPVFLGNAPVEVLSRESADLGWLQGEARRPEVYEAVTRGGATISVPRKTLVIRGVDDEAGLILAAGSIATKLLSVGLLASLRVGQTLCILLAVFLLLLIYGKNAGGLPVETMSLLLPQPLTAYLAFGLAAVFCLIPIASCLLKSVYGRELVLGGYFCDIKSASAPDCASDVTLITLPPSDAGMRHGIYRHKMTPNTIAQFVRDNLGHGQSTASIE